MLNIDKNIIHFLTDIEVTNYAIYVIFKGPRNSFFVLIILSQFFLEGSIILNYLKLYLLNV